MRFGKCQGSCRSYSVRVIAYPRIRVLWFRRFDRDGLIVTDASAPPSGAVWRPGSLGQAVAMTGSPNT
jgi:hypothetical protein